jgi:hypothetical protein
MALTAVITSWKVEYKSTKLSNLGLWEFLTLAEETILKISSDA